MKNEQIFEIIGFWKFFQV